MNEMTKDGIIIRNNKKITIKNDAFTYQKPTISIKISQIYYLYVQNI